jgi:hypothetical protein
LVRAVVVVVATPVIVVDRRVVVEVRDVAAGVAVGVTAAVVVEADGCSGAAAFCTCVAAKEVIPPSDVSVIAVATPRSTTLERINGAVLRSWALLAPLLAARCCGMS